MFRNDFRFFPLSHQDLHILSWFTPYVKIWMLVNAAELFLIVILGAKIIGILSEQEGRGGTLLMLSILFLFDDATGFTFFQFIYPYFVCTRRILGVSTSLGPDHIR